MGGGSTTTTARSTRASRGRHVATLGDLVGRIERLEVRCTKCDRAGRVRLDKLIAEHGTDMGLPDLAVRLAANCPKVQATSPADRCFVVFPQLVTLTLADQNPDMKNV
jgi:hypothetical protein